MTDEPLNVMDFAALYERPAAHACPVPARPDEHRCHLNDGTPVTGPHACWHCHDDPPAGHTCPCCGALPRVIGAKS